MFHFSLICNIVPTLSNLSFTLSVTHSYFLSISTSFSLLHCSILHSPSHTHTHCARALILPLTFYYYLSNYVTFFLLLFTLSPSFFHLLSLCLSLCLSLPLPQYVLAACHPCSHPSRRTLSRVCVSLTHSLTQLLTVSFSLFYQFSSSLSTLQFFTFSICHSYSFSHHSSPRLSLTLSLSLCVFLVSHSLTP